MPVLAGGVLFPISVNWFFGCKGLKNFVFFLPINLKKLAVEIFIFYTEPVGWEKHMYFFKKVLEHTLLVLPTSQS